MRSHSPPCKGGAGGDSLCADESPSNSPFARGRIELPLQRLHDGAAFPLLFQRRGQGWFVRDVPTSLQSRRDDRVQAGATPLYHGPPPHKSPEGTTELGNKLTYFATQLCLIPTAQVEKIFVSFLVRFKKKNQYLCRVKTIRIKIGNDIAVDLFMRSHPLPVRAGFKRGWLRMNRSTAISLPKNKDVTHCSVHR